MSDFNRTNADTKEDSRDAAVVDVVGNAPESRVIKRDKKGRLLPGSGDIPRKKARGMKGNLNGVRNPWAVFWRRRALRPEDKWALALVRDYVPQLMADKGGNENVSFAQEKVMEVAAVSRVCWALALVHGNLKAVARFISSERSALAALGLERRAKPMPSLADVMREAAKGEEGEK